MENLKENCIKLLKENYNIVLTGAPGTGKTYLAKEIAREISADGIISVADTNITYEIVNLGKKTIYLFTPDLSNISSNSYFTNSLLTIIV